MNRPNINLFIMNICNDGFNCKNTSCTDWHISKNHCKKTPLMPINEYTPYEPLTTCKVEKYNPCLIKIINTNSHFNLCPFSIKTSSI